MEAAMKTHASHGSAILFVLLLGNLQTASAGQDTVPSTFTLPVWRIQVEAYGEGPGSIASVYHRLGSRWDLGMIVSADLNGRDEDSNRDADDDSERIDNRSSFGLEPEFREWTSRGPSLSTFMGFRAGAAIGRRSFELTERGEDGSGHRNESDTDWTELRMGFSLGADVQVVRHLSVLFAIVPVDFTYRWETTKSTIQIFPNQPDPTDTLHSKRLDAGLHLVPGLYATVSF
jgi:hypothetical protein